MQGKSYKKNEEQYPKEYKSLSFRDGFDVKQQKVLLKISK